MSASKAKSRLANAVPPPPVSHFSERQKQAIELGGEAEHAHGQKREALIRQAQDLDKPKATEDSKRRR